MTILQVSRGQYTGYEVITKIGGVYDTEGIDLLLGGADLREVDDILFNIDSDRNITNSASTMRAEVESGAIFIVNIANVDEYTFTASAFDVGGNIISEVALIQGLTTTNKIDDTTSGWIYGAPTSHRFAIGGVNKFQIANGITSHEDNFVDMQEQSDPLAPGANTGRRYMRDNGAGKTEYVVRFPTGAIQVIATQP